MEETTECFYADGNVTIEEEKMMIPGKIMKRNKIRILKRNRAKKVCYNGQ